MREFIGTTLQPVAAALHDMLAAIPMWMVAVLVYLLLGALGVWMLLKKPEKGADGSRFDLRWFALGVIVLQIAMYVIFV